MSNSYYLRGKSPGIIESALGMQRVGAILTDPPYSTGASPDVQYGRRQKRGIDHGDQFIHNDLDLAQLEACLPLMRSVLHPLGVAMIFGAPSKSYEQEGLLREAWPWVQRVIWDKGSPGLTHKLRWAVEDIYVCAAGDPWELMPSRLGLISPLRCARVRNPIHPNQKPVKLLRQLLRWALPLHRLYVTEEALPRSCVDLFAGVGSVSVAALAENIEVTAAESDSQWWPHAEAWIAESQGRPHHTHQQHLLALEEGRLE